LKSEETKKPTDKKMLSENLQKCNDEWCRNKQTVKAIEKILTPVQLAKFEKMHQKFHDQHKHMPSDDFDEPGGPPQKAGS